LSAYNAVRPRPRCGPGTSLYREAASTTREIDMGKYFLGWLLGVPVVVLVIAYFFFG
jgi:hypothetical protein